ncbi:glycoside hydrolase family 16 protein [Kitasatospora sp. NPDC002227]|uniref:glycoside hydrolase family 16 protein n=1 Tax=Kitasatospora sp. NPDC002227 TaxID=3154773 RepID=UPI00331F1E46
MNASPLPPAPVQLTLALWLLAASGWLALASVALDAGSPLRAVLPVLFLFACPGAAVVRAAWPGAGGRSFGLLGAALLSVTLSAALTAVTTVVLYLAHGFTAGRLVILLAAFTTVLVLLPRWGRRALAGLRRSGDRSPRPRRHQAEFAGAALLTLTAACGGGSMAQQPGTTHAPASRMPNATADATTSTDPVDQPAAPGPWHSVLHDDFAAPALDRTTWTTCYDWNQDGCTNQGNHETEWYQPGQVQTGQGGLTLTATRRPTQGSDGTVYPWASGMVSTGRDSWNDTPRRTFTYGYFAAAIQVPADATGMFPAFWLIPAETRSAPPELDIAEFINTNQRVDMNLHWKTSDGSDGHVGQTTSAADFASTYHVFAMDWEPDSVTWYVDGVQRFQVTKPSMIPHVAMEVVFDLAVGFEVDPPASVDSAQLHVAWVGVWQH